MGVDPALAQADRDPAHLHPVLRRRWQITQDVLSREFGLPTLMTEGFRSNARQAWLWAQGRTAEACQAKGIDPTWARPGGILTNAWSSKVSAHGWVFNGEPMAAAVDVVPLGTDGKPYTNDDPWDHFLAVCTREAGRFGLVHFTSHGVITDRPHLQLAEWSDADHTLHLYS